MGFIGLEFDITNYYVDYYKKIYNKSYTDINMLELGDQIFYRDHPSVEIYQIYQTTLFIMLEKFYILL
jgi:hypothetical protein